MVLQSSMQKQNLGDRKSDFVISFDYHFSIVKVKSRNIKKRGFLTKNIEKIKNLEKNHKLLSENLIDAIWTADVENFQFEYITESIQKISGYTSDEYINLPVRERMTPEFSKKITAILAEEIPRFKKGIKSVRKLEIFPNLG